jgi:GDP/UDP-N,N'-diacetylbacillosamine 2-epimerase (hydrolysing)
MKIFLVTSSRADFGLLKNLIFELKKKNYIDLRVIATGSHFSNKYGYSLNEIKFNKINLYKKIFIKSNTSSPKFILSEMNILSQRMSFLLKKDEPELLILLGDRYETFAICLAAYISKIPIAHIHGGEITNGSLDDGYRHCISKMSNFHFVSHKNYKKRLVQLGENPKTIYNVGSLGVENIYKTKLLNKSEIEKIFKINLKKKILLICIHPEITRKLTVNLVREILAALNRLNDISLIFTLPGADLHNDIIFKNIKMFIKKKSNRFLFKTLGSQKFLSFLKIADAIIGNSSSGIIEMPTFKKPTINIGLRQSGRIKSNSIIDVLPKRNLIIKKINFIYSKKINTNNIVNFYRSFNTSKKICTIIKNLNFKKYKNKKFYDIKY